MPLPAPADRAPAQEPCCTPSWASLLCVAVACTVGCTCAASLRSVADGTMKACMWTAKGWRKYNCIGRYEAACERASRLNLTHFSVERLRFSDKGPPPVVVHWLWNETAVCKCKVGYESHRGECVQRPVAWMDPYVAVALFETSALWVGLAVVDVVSWHQTAPRSATAVNALTLFASFVCPFVLIACVRVAIIRRQHSL